MTPSKLKQSVVSFLALFTSTGTLICCALPAAVAAIAGGAAVGALISMCPWLIPLSQYKEILFVVAGIFIAGNGILTLSPKGQLACAITGAGGCEVASTFQKSMFWLSVSIYLVGAFFAYGIIPVLRFFGG